MEALQALKAIESSEAYNEWRKSNAEAYLTSMFAMFSGSEERKWLVTYYDRAQERMTTFSADGQRSSEEPFSRDRKIPELKLEDVKVDDEKAIKAANGAFRKNYPGEAVQKAVMVLQSLDSKPLWNVTLIATTMKVINIKIAASTGAVLDHSMSSIADFIQKK